MRHCLPAWILGLAVSAASASLPFSLARATDAGVESAAEQARRSQILAKGEGFSISVGMLEDQINKQPPALRARFRTPEERKALLTSMVRLELLAAEAARRGLDQGPAVQQTLKDGAVQGLLRVEIDEKISAETVSQEDIAAYYEANPGDFHHPAQRRASHIALGSEAEAQALLPEAKQADLHAFAELAKKRSLDSETKLRGGDLGFFPLSPGREDWTRKVPEALRKVTFGLAAVGATADAPVAVGNQFSILRFTGERPERHVSLSDAEGTIRSRLWRERRRKAVDGLIDGLRGREQPKVYVERIDWVKFDDMDKRPPGFAPDPLPRRPAPGSLGRPPTAPKPGEQGAAPKGAAGP
jgi:peptidyl-prolyl cis-trans isomerase C